MRKHRALTVALAAVFTFSAVGVAFATVGTIGNEVRDRSSMDTSWTNWWIVDTNVAATADGKIETFDYYARTTNQFKLFLVDPDREVKWVSELITPALGMQTFVPGEPVGVVEGWHIGIYYAQTGVIPFDSGGTTYIQGSDQAGEPSVGETLVDGDTRDRVYSVGATIVEAAPQTKDVCKDGGWEEYGFRNQGQCIASLMANENAGK